MVPWNGARTKVQIKLSIQRLRTLQEKKLALAKKSRREIADLLLRDRVETAKLRVEGLIQDDIYVELLELLELYSEKLQARFNLLDVSTGSEPEASISDAVCAIVYAAPRTELKELQQLREMLMQKYGRNWALTLQPGENNAAPPESVPARIRSKLALYIPERELVDAYLYEIAKGYGVDWTPEPPASSSAPADKVDDEGDESGADGGDDDDNDGPGGGVGERAKEAIAVPAGDKAEKEEKEDPSAKVSSYPKDKGTDALPSAPTAPAPTKKLTPEEELAQRFERLKKL